MFRYNVGKEFPHKAKPILFKYVTVPLLNSRGPLHTPILASRIYSSLTSGQETLGLLVGASEELKQKALRKALVTIRSANTAAKVKWEKVCLVLCVHLQMCSRSNNQRVLSPPGARGQILRSTQGQQVEPVEPRLSLGPEPADQVASGGPGQRALPVLRSLFGTHRLGKRVG